MQTIWNSGQEGTPLLTRAAQERMEKESGFVAFAIHKATGTLCNVATFTDEQRAAAYCQDMKKRCRSHEAFSYIPCENIWEVLDKSAKNH